MVLHLFWGIDFKMAIIITYQESFKIFMKKTIELFDHNL